MTNEERAAPYFNTLYTKLTPPHPYAKNGQCRHIELERKLLCADSVQPVKAEKHEYATRLK